MFLPLNNMMLQAGYKNPVYKKEWGWEHYGVDATDPSSRNIYGMGYGKVVACGQDGETLTGANSRLGNVVVIVYRDVELVDGTVRDLACRMYHLAKINVKVGEEVTPDTVVGQYGNTGANTTGAHLHIEFDTDTKFPTLAPGVSIGKGKIINTAKEYAKAGGIADSTIDPAKVWVRGVDQTIGSKWVGTWVDESDLDIRIEEGETKDEEIKRLRDAITAYEVERNKILAYVNKLSELLGVKYGE